MGNASHDATTLPKLLQQDPPIPNIITTTTPEQPTPPHITTAMSESKRGSTPLHLAAASGDLELVRALVAVDPDACLARDKDGRTPAHVAAMRGRTSALRELLEARPEAARGVNREGSVLHLCVECCQFEALKMVIESVDFQEFVNWKDGNGNTALHLAVADKQTQTIEYLLNHNLIEANTPNAYGLAPIDILFQTLRHKNDLTIAQMLQNHAAAAALRPPQTRALHQPEAQQAEKHDDWIERQRDALMVVASLIASMGFTAGVAPPAGVLAVQREPTAWSYYSRFLVYNTVSFMSSISIIVLLVSGVPFRRRAFMWALMVVVWVALASTACTYAVAVEHHLQYKDIPVLRSLFGFGLLTWVFVMAIVVGFHVSRVFVKVVGRFRKRARVYGREVGIQAV